MGLYFSKKASIMLIMSSEQKKQLSIQIKLFQSKAILVLNDSDKFE